MVESAVPQPSKRLTWTAFLTAVTCVALIFIAYSLLRFPVPAVNEPHYLCKSRSFSDSAWCRGDFFLESSNAHAVFFRLVGPATLRYSFETVAIAGRCLSLILLACGWISVSSRLHNDRWSGVLSAAIFCGLAMTGNFSGEWVVGGFESKVPAYAFALIALGLWLDAIRSPTARRYVAAGTFCGLSMALHPVVGAWFSVGIALSEICLWSFERLRQESKLTRSLKVFLTHGVVFFTCAMVAGLPGLIPAVESVLASEMSRTQSDQANQIQVFWRLAHHLDPSTFPQFAWLHTAGLLSSLIFGFAMLKRFQPATADASQAPSRESNWPGVVVLLAMSLLIAAIGIAIGWHGGSVSEMAALSLRTTLLKFYPFRFFDALLPMVVSWGFARLLLMCVPPKRGIPVAITFLFSATVLAAACFRQSAVPSGYSADAFRSWRAACAWLQENTSSDSLIYGPREGFALKWYAGRAEYVCFKDCPQDAAGILEWNRRLWVMHGWARASWKDGQCDDGDLNRLHEATGVTHILTRRLGPFQSVPIYEAGTWKVYATRPGQVQQ